MPRDVMSCERAAVASLIRNRRQRCARRFVTSTTSAPLSSQQPGGRDREDRVGRAGRGPYLVERQQCGIAHGRHRFGMTERRRAADRIAGRDPSFVGLRLTRRTAEVRAEPRRDRPGSRPTSTRAPARRRRRRTPATSRSRRRRSRWRPPRPAAVRVPSGYCVTSIVTPAACIASTKRFIASTRAG